MGAELTHGPQPPTFRDQPKYSLSPEYPARRFPSFQKYLHRSRTCRRSSPPLVQFLVQFLARLLLCL